MSTSGLREKPKRARRVIALIAAILWAALIFFLSATPGSAFPSHPNALNVVAHFGEYLLLAALLALAIDAPRRPLWQTALIAVLLASLYGASDELHQLFVAGRSADPVDWVVDTAGALVGAIVTVWVLSAQRVRKSRMRDAGPKGRPRQ
jgi:VanZ family protein